MAIIAQRTEQVLAAFQDTESLSILLVSGATRSEVAAVLNVDLSAPVEDGWSDDEELTAWAVLEVPAGVLAVEISGYGDPSCSALTTLSANGRSAAVTRSNIQAHYRFGCARNGELLFDDDEYLYGETLEPVPVELHPFFELAREWLTAVDNDPDSVGDAPGPLLVGLAMAEKWTGVEAHAEKVDAVYDSGFFAAPNLVYPDSTP